MSDASRIEWTEATWNPVRGCTKVSAGCKNCYAETFAERWRGIPGHAYEHGFDVRLVPEALELPLRWRKPRRVFVNSMSDLFHEDVPDHFIERVWAVMLICARRERSAHTFQILTKRAARMREFLAPSDERLVRVARIAGSMMEDGDGWHDEVRFGGLVHPRIWLGVSVEDQAAADERIPHLLATPAALRFLSCEPLLGPVDLRNPLKIYAHRGPPCCLEHEGLHRLGEGSGRPPRSQLGWVIVGGESGPRSRPCDVAWARSLVEQCRAAGVPAFVKQFGARSVVSPPQGQCPTPGIRDRKGGDPDEWPADLRVRQMPEVTR